MNRNEDQAAVEAAAVAADDGGGLVAQILSIEVARTFAAANVHLNC